MNKVIIAGAGIGGLATAIRLRARGLSVRLIEQQAVAGGKVAQITADGYRWDTGPSLFTLPHLLTELFELAGENPADWFTYRKLAHICQYFYPDGTQINVPAEADQLAESLRQSGLATPAETERFFRRSRQIYNLTADVFLFNSFYNPALYFSAKFWKSLAISWKLGALKTMHQANIRFFSDKRMVQMMDRFATYNGSNPYLAPATLNCIPHLEHSLGAYFPDKGMFSIVDSLYRLAVKMGVEFAFSTKVESVDKVDRVGFIVGTDRCVFHSDYFVSDIDLLQFSRILHPEIRPRYLVQERSSSALVFYWAMNKSFPAMQLHNIFFSADYQTEFAALFQSKTLADDLTIYVFVSCRQVPSDAPEGCENWFVMVNAPSNSGLDWENIRQQARLHILRSLERQLGCAIEPHISREFTLDPAAIERKTGSVDGALYGNSSNNRFAAFLRHPNHHPAVKGLFFTGGSVHPGGGIPLCLASARLAEEALVRQAGRGLGR